MIRAVLAIAILACLPGNAGAQESRGAESGKTMRLLISSGPGAIYDLYGRLVARHLSAFLPGNPAVIAENMQGADGLKAANYLYNNAPKDGSVIGSFNSALPFYQALNQPGIRFAAENFAWIGSLRQPTAFIGVWHSAGIRSLEDAKHKEVIMGATGAGGTMAGYPALLNSFFGTRFKIVTGYDSANAVDLAMEREEVQGRAVMTWPTYATSRPSWMTEGKIVPILQVGPAKDPHFPNVPLLTELASDAGQRKMFELVSSTVSIGQPFATNPGVSAARLDILRAGFDAMGRDPGFIADTAKIAGVAEGIGVIHGAETQRIVTETTATPPDLVEKVKKAMYVKVDGR